MRALLSTAKALCGCATALALLATLLVVSLFHDWETEEAQDWTAME